MIHELRDLYGALTSELGRLYKIFPTIAVTKKIQRRETDWRERMLKQRKAGTRK